MDKINFMDKIKKVESGKLCEFTGAWYVGRVNRVSDMGSNIFWRRLMI